mmetsp:Transcript_64256/g.178494  ORF Transcript_64256/g.178494 Transcript_64256/m.178494 type:complete len:253 (+) Transcript_64256:914-1672(+)
MATSVGPIAPGAAPGTPPGTPPAAAPGIALGTAPGMAPGMVLGMEPCMAGNGSAEAGRGAPLASSMALGNAGLLASTPGIVGAPFIMLTLSGGGDIWGGVAASMPINSGGAFIMVTVSTAPFVSEALDMPLTFPIGAKPPAALPAAPMPGAVPAAWSIALGSALPELAVPLGNTPPSNALGMPPGVAIFIMASFWTCDLSTSTRWLARSRTRATSALMMVSCEPNVGNADSKTCANSCFNASKLSGVAPGSF